ncbi:chromatin modification-related protein MEAF6 [Cyclospora cayetanensis]|nr:chromatin modification-related protein MEAF6 [Cyclospora cayetanensis]
MLKLHEKLESDVLLLENKIYEMEGNYLAATADVGNMIKGWEGYISSATKTRRPAAKAAGSASSNQERLFSLTSTTSRASRELSTWASVEDSERQLMGSSGGKGWNNGAASQVSNSRNSACSTNVKCAKKPPSRTGSSSNASKGISGGRHSSGTGGGSTSAVSQKACGGAVTGDAPIGSACHGRM